MTVSGRPPDRLLSGGPAARVTGGRRDTCEQERRGDKRQVNSHYSYRKATIGSTFMARRAGR